MTDIQRAMLGDHDAAARLTEQGVLIPCPCCNNSKIDITSYKIGFWYYCTSDNCDVSGPTMPSEYTARLAWNTRAPLLTPEQIDMLERMESK